MGFAVVVRAQAAHPSGPASEIGVGPATSHALRQRPRSIDEVVDTAKQLAEQNQNRLVVEPEANLGAVSDTQARAAVAPMDPFALMTSAKQLPTEHFADYAFVF